MTNFYRELRHLVIGEISLTLANVNIMSWETFNMLLAADKWPALSVAWIMDENMQLTNKRTKLKSISLKISGKMVK